MEQANTSRSIQQTSATTTAEEAPSNYYAHSHPDFPNDQSKWQKLEDHLQATAEMAREFAEPFGSGEWAYLAGLWHDLGKYSNEFQRMLCEANGVECHLETKPGRPIHSQAGGHLAQQTMADAGLDRIFCWLIMGHHAGLADYSSDRTGAKALEPKMRDHAVSDEILANVPDGIKTHSNPTPPDILRKNQPADISFLTRMIFSCIVDADFLDTESFMDRKRKQLRREPYPPIDVLLAALDQHMEKLCRGTEPTQVNTIRADVLKQCMEAAKQDPQVFSLTVPTGGGKTLSSLAFALHHAVNWQKRRIIYVIPYTSIIEQTARVFREISGFERAVLEHHSNVADDDECKESVRRRLAAENWDAPIIVTTSVQFFESLYACKTSRCRKLHNIANSVVIFDEAQCLSTEYLRPVTFAIRELQRHYRVTPLLCTATQPVLTQTEQFDFKFQEGFERVTEIIANPSALSAGLDRVSVECYADLQPVSYDELAGSIRSERQSALCIVNRKQDCRQLAQLLPEAQTIHLSTNMCPKHRLMVFETIRERLNPDDDPLYVISTSLVEAGVDLDFPVVYRALAGLDSIAQAAGRCNREGKLERGRTVIFLPEQQPGYVGAPASLAQEFLTTEALKEVFLPETFTRYFKSRFFQLGADALDKKGILSLLGGNLDFYYRTAAQEFRLIDDDWQLPLIVPFGEAPVLVDKLLDWDARSLFRKLQLYTINIAKQVMWKLVEDDYVRELEGYPGTYFLHASTPYTERFGFVPPGEVDNFDPESTII